MPIEEKRFGHIERFIEARRQADEAAGISRDYDPTKIAIHFDPTHQRMVGTARHGNTPFDVPFISHIHGNLWQGGCENGLLLPDSFEYVVSLYPWEQYLADHEFVYLPFKMFDAVEDFDPEPYEAIADVVVECAEKGQTLVHCQAGLNRSGLVAGIALVKMGVVENGAEAIELLRSTRSRAVLCNPVFAGWLKDYVW